MHLRGIERCLIWTPTSDPSHSTLFNGGTLLTDKEAIFKRWSDNLEDLFSDQCTAQESSMAKISQVDVKLEFDDAPMHEEIQKTTMQLKMGKLPGTDGFSAEVYLYGLWGRSSA